MKYTSPVSIDDTNRNTAWVHRTGFRVAYIVLLVIGFLTLRLFVFSSNAYCATALLQLHALITFYLVHWRKGAPELSEHLQETSQASQTFWEQIDNSYLGTPTRRFFAVVPILLFFFALCFTREDVKALFFNAASTVVLIVAKSGALFGVRLFHVNAD